MDWISKELHKRGIIPPKERWENEAANFPQEKRQEILDLFRAGEMSTGEIRKKFDMDQGVVSEIICQNIIEDKFHSLRELAL